MNAQHVGLILLAGAALGSSAVMTRFGLREIPPLMMVMLRFAVATLAYAITLLALRRKLPREGVIWRDIALSGILATGGPLILFTLSLQFVSAGVLTIFLALIPLFTGLIAHYALAHERLNLSRAAGLLLALAGAILIIATGTTGLAASVGADGRGQALALVGALMAAVGLVYTRSRLREADTLVASAGQVGFSLLVIAPLALAFNRLDLAAVTWRGELAVVYSGLIGSFVPFMLIFFLTKKFGATSASLVGYIVPVVASILGVLILGEVITWALVAGGVLIVAGVFFSSR